MTSLAITDKRKFREQVKKSICNKEGCLTWKEFLDFYFMKDIPLEDRLGRDNWWIKQRLCVTKSFRSSGCFRST